MRASLAVCADMHTASLPTSAGTYVWTSPACGSVSVVAVGGGAGGGWQWSSGGGDGGGLGYIKKYRVEKVKTYTIVVGKGGPCVPNATTRTPRMGVQATSYLRA